MQLEKRRLITLHHCPGLTIKALQNLLMKDPTLERLYTMNPPDIASYFTTTQKQARSIYHHIHNNNVSQLLSIYKEQSIVPLTIWDKDYPALLKEIYDPPVVLYTKGNQHLLKTRMLGIVGARLMSSYGNHSLNKLIPPLVKEKFTIVSGLAKGVDISAHQLTMEKGGNTIAVLGSGFFQIYPKEHLSYAEKIASHQLLLSEYPPYTPPTRWNFPQRNRIISGLSEGVIIIEAKEKSGSLITADQSMEQGREVFAVPGSILSETSKGTNALIQQGAKLVTSHHDILEELRSREMIKINK
ncbi:DNA-protecting protein DprA [Sutcliffiella horikoshii]|uniref:DNA-protecting protein DprA n=1 Tax=Sutcliffiella horikoshii TaxID=79883 RepID=A0AA95B8Z1_9BACI|nr:DNA-processing protein DprA [Sutcliffiella horikoshii]TYS61595.1 DNA-protecting protein DprA [Sutcliffiella horikoshii]